MLWRLRKLLHRDFRAKAQRAFSDALANFSHVVNRQRPLPLVVAVLGPRLPDSELRLHAFSRDFIVSSGRSFMAPATNTYVPGALLFHLSDHAHATRFDLPFLGSIVEKKRGSLSLSPAAGAEGFDDDVLNRITAFAHLVLGFKGKTAVVFVPTLQKVTSYSRSRRVKDGRPVDLFVGSHGPDRHLLFLSAAQEIVDKMNQGGVKTELHVASPETLVPWMDESMKTRVQKPFAKLAQHFERGSLRFHGISFPTINLSRPKKS